MLPDQSITPTIYNTMYLESLRSLNSGSESVIVTSYQAPCKFFKNKKVQLQSYKTKDTLKVLHFLPSDSTSKTKTGLMFHTTTFTVQRKGLKKSYYFPYTKTGKYSEMGLRTGSNTFKQRHHLRTLKITSYNSELH